MKKVLLLALTFFALHTNSFAQTSLGPRFGLNVSSVKANGGNKQIREAINNTYKSTTGIQTGVAFNFPVSGSVSFQTEVLFSQMGLTLKEDGTKVTLRQSYLQVPVLFKINALLESAVQLYFLGGPYAAYWLSGKMKVEQDGQSIKLDYEFDDDFSSDGLKNNRLDFGASAGAGLGYEVGPGTASFDVRYNFGFSDVLTYKDGRPNDMPRLGTRNLNFNLTYLFKLGQ